MQKNFLQGLYDAAAGFPDENGIPKFDEEKLRRKLKHTRLGSRNKDIFRDIEPKFSSCPRYDPCPICDKCRNKASHLYVACQTCNIVTCTHTYTDRQRMIKRKNFTEYVSKEVMNDIIELDKTITGE